MGEIAEKGYEQEVKKSTPKGMAAAKSATKKNIIKCKCGDCNKVIGNKIAIKCNKIAN